METGTNNQNAKDNGIKRQLPKNIRQIGNMQGPVRIYMEDYVYTYLHGSVKPGWNNKGSILLGTRFQENGQKYIFISGLVCMKDDAFLEGIPQFSDLMWGCIYQEMKQYYDNVEIIGWAMDVSGACAKLTGELEQIHRKAFEGQDKLIFLMDAVENEEAFYIYEKNMLRRRDGYYVYYEKNPQMQEYMLKDQVKESSTETDPQKSVVSSYRAMAAEKNKNRGRGFRAFVYAASLALLVTVSAMSVNMMTNSRKMEALEAAVTFLETDKTKVESDVKPVAGITGAIAQNTTDIAQQQQEYQEEQKQQEEDAERKDVQENDLKTEDIETGSTETGSTETDSTETDNSEANDAEAAGEEADIQKTADVDDKQEEEPKKSTDTPAIAPQEQDYYVVEKGDSLLSISQKIYGRDYTKELCEANGLEDENKIYAGQKLLLLDK